VIALISICAAAYADIGQEPHDGNTPVTLQEYLRYAALNNAGLKAAFEQFKAAVEQVPQARALPDPKFTYGYYIEEVETKEGPRSQNLQLMQMFPWFGTIQARTDAAASAAKAAKKRYEAAKLELFFQVKDTFFEYAFLARAVEIAQENLELIKHFEEVARAKYIAAAAAHPDVVRAQIELAKFEDQLITLQEFRKPVVARLNAVLNRRSFEMLPWPHKEQFQLVTLGRQQIIESLQKQNPELQALSWDIQSAKTEVELAKKKFYPDIGLGVEWMTNMGMMGTGLKNSEKDEVVLMLGVNLPIWRDSYKAGEQQAKANVRKATEHKTQAENTLIAQTEQALYDLEDSGRKARLYGDVLVPKAQELLFVSEEAYKAGKVDFLSLIDSQRLLLEYQLSYERAVANYAQKLAELEMLAGTELAPLPQETAAVKADK
jgi:outer membrane protein TolC